MLQKNEKVFSEETSITVPYYQFACHVSSSQLHLMTAVKPAHSPFTIPINQLTFFLCHCTIGYNDVHIQTFENVFILFMIFPIIVFQVVAFIP
jgi:hypothetical protein